MSPSVSRKPSEQKIRPYLRLSIVEAAKRRFPDFEGSDADFIEWILSSVNAGVMGFYGQVQPIQKSQTQETSVVDSEVTPDESTGEESLNLLDEEAD